MSLICHECKQDMGPSEELPGREGTMVYPNLLSLIYTASDSKKEEPNLSYMGEDYCLGYVPAPENRSLCFRCIEKGLPERKKETTLRRMYDAYEAETEWRGAKEKLEGKLISMNDPISIKHSKTFDRYRKLKKQIFNSCLFCDRDVENGKPFFQAQVIDRIYSRKHLSGLFVNTNYSHSNMKNGSTAFRICFEDFRKYFPNCFEQLSYDLIRERNPNIQPISELYINSDFKGAAKREGVDLDKWKKDLKKVGMNIIDKDN